MEANWIELRCCIDADARADLEAFLEAAGAASITLTHGDGSLFQASGTDDSEHWEHLEIRAQFASGKDLDPVLSSVRERLPPGTLIEVIEIQDRAWEHSWREHWQPQLFSGGLCVCPTWCVPPPSANHVVFLDPGRAFGTGTHETTTFAIDIDDEALDVTRDNARVNGLGNRVRIGRPELLVAANADIIIANILLEPLLTLESRFQALLTAGGWLVLSGLLANQTAPVLEVYSRRFNMGTPIQRGEWVLLSGLRC